MRKISHRLEITCRLLRRSAEHWLKHVKKIWIYQVSCRVYDRQWSDTSHKVSKCAQHQFRQNQILLKSNIYQWWWKISQQCEFIWALAFPVLPACLSVCTTDFCVCTWQDSAFADHLCMLHVFTNLWTCLSICVRALWQRVSFTVHIHWQNNEGRFVSHLFGLFGCVYWSYTAVNCLMTADMST